jgi:uncharacterized protein (DUF1501 family)
MGSPIWSPKLWRPSRRGLLAASAALLSAGPARASTTGTQRFIFIFTGGGWDVTRVFASLLDSPDVSTEADAALATMGGLTYVSHPDRPSVDAYMASWADRTLVINGLYCPSISHGGATLNTYTGAASGRTADWPTRIAAAESEQYLLPYLLLGGPNFAGQDGISVWRSGVADQLQSLLNGEILQTADWPTTAVEAGADQIEAWLRGVGERRLSSTNTRKAERAAQWLEAWSRMEQLESIDVDLSLGSSDSSFADQRELAIRALSSGLSRVVTLCHPRQTSLNAWDTHSMNDASQSELFASLFSELDALLTDLSSNTAPEGCPLLGSTTVVVFSEMARAPVFNSSLGKDHWPFGSALIISDRVTGGRVVGGFDSYQNGLPMDYQSGELDEGGELFGVENLGATLLTLADVDLVEQNIAAEPLAGVLL